MATESVATGTTTPREAISPMDLGSVEMALKQIRGISMMGSSADCFDHEDAQWAFYNLASVAEEALKLIRGEEEEG